VFRVVAVGGDELSIEDGEAVVDGEAVSGDWETEPCGNGGSACNLRKAITVPEAHYFVADWAPGTCGWKVRIVRTQRPHVRLARRDFQRVKRWLLADRSAQGQARLFDQPVVAGAE
jgi:hypothetical protein